MAQPGMPLISLRSDDAMYFDTHAHYDSPAFDRDRAELLSGLPQAGVELALIPGCELDSSQKALDCARRFPHFTG